MNTAQQCNVTMQKPNKTIHRTKKQEIASCCVATKRGSTPMGALHRQKKTHRLAQKNFLTNGHVDQPQEGVAGNMAYNTCYPLDRMCYFSTKTITFLTLPRELHFLLFYSLHALQNLAVVSNRKVVQPS